MTLLAQVDKEIPLIYLLDANVLITANRQYYAIDRVPNFWNWLIAKGISGDIKIVEEVFDEFTGGTDGLAAWATDNNVKRSLLLQEQVNVPLVRNVISNGYAPDLTDVETEQLGRDPFLIAYALSAPLQRTVVTLEARKPTRLRANRHVPDVCDNLGIKCIDTFNMLFTLDFRI